MASKVSIADVDAFMDAAFDGNYDGRPNLSVIEDGRAVVSLAVTDANIRPGGYISGPTQMALADHAAYVAIFTKIGIVPMAVTSNLSINFLRPCKGKSVEADAKILKIGRTLAVVDVEMRGESSDKVSSHAVVTYSIPAE